MRPWSGTWTGPISGPGRPNGIWARASNVDRPSYAYCLSHLGLILCDVGRWDEAEIALRLAGGRSRDGGARIVGQARAALAECGSPAAGWTMPAGCSPTEPIIRTACCPLAPLRLADGAYADAVVVARLHNSVRTIEHHVGEILAGLGLRGRAEAAVYAVSLQVKEAVE